MQFQRQIHLDSHGFSAQTLKINSVIKLWTHEVWRVFADRLTNEDDKLFLREVIKRVFGANFDNVMANLDKPRTYFAEKFFFWFPFFQKISYLVRFEPTIKSFPWLPKTKPNLKQTLFNV